ncbi:MAG: DUF5615 family PIN-like protein [Balneolaceae bacterium]
MEILQQEYPGSNHVRNVGLRGAEDNRIWNYCKKEDFIIVSKDTDFRDRSFIEGYPPKIIWLDVGNAGTIEISELLRREKKRVQYFTEQKEASLLMLSLPGNVV